MSAIELLSLVLAAVFVLLAVWTILQWLRWRSASTRYLAIAFTSLAVGIVISRLDSLTAFAVPWPRVLTLLNVILAAFPWLLAAAVWSLGDHGRPRWSSIGFVGLPLIAVWLYFAPVFGDPIRPAEQLTFLALFAGLWALPAVATAVHLRRVSREHALARPRMRLMAVGLLTLAAAVLIDLVGAAAEAQQHVVMNSVAVLGALAFLFGFAAPRPLRMWWRRGTVTAFQAMQTDLLGAMTREQVASAVVGPLSQLLAGGVIVVGEDGTELGRHGLDADRAAEISARIRDRRSLGVDARATSVGRGWLAVVMNPYTPVFGQDEFDLVDAYAMQVRISLERAELFESITVQQRDLEAMLLGLAHDIRSPTAAISGSAQLFPDADDRGLRAELSQLVLSSTAYLERLVDAMMELGQVRSGERDREPVALASVARDVAERVCAGNPRIQVEVDGDDTTVLMSPVRAEQLFDNLLGNAAKHGGRDDLTITVQIATLDDDVEVVVADDGVGIDPADHQRIFTPFQRGSGALGVGNGLGLGLVRRIIDGVGGRLTLEPSEHGARFVLRIPVEPAIAMVGEPEAPTAG